MLYNNQKQEKCIFWYNGVPGNIIDMLESVSPQLNTAIPSEVREQDVFTKS
jgi:hypothetical protein